MPTYVKADAESVKLLEDVKQTHHHRLVAADVAISLVAAVAKVDEDTGEPVGPALKHHGYPALAKVRIVQHRDRVQGMADAEIILDGDRWTFLSREERVAILDHEMTHIELVFDDRNDVKLDDGGRPRLKMRLHDYEFGWFTEVAERHGKAAIEVQQAQALVDENGQVYFPFLGKGGRNMPKSGDERATRAAVKDLAGIVKDMNDKGITVSMQVGNNEPLVMNATK